MSRFEEPQDVEIEVTVKAFTSKAVLVERNDFEVWIPLSVVNLNASDVELRRGAEGTLSIAQWFADKEGIE